MQTTRSDTAHMQYHIKIQKSKRKAQFKDTNLDKRCGLCWVGQPSRAIQCPDLGNRSKRALIMHKAYVFRDQPKRDEQGT